MNSIIWRHKLSKRCVLITGGARSGKSRFAQELAIRVNESVLFVATAQAGDEEMQERIQRHKKARPASWNTLEATTNIGSQISQEIAGARVVIIDCIALLVNNIFSQYSDPNGEQTAAPLIEEKVIGEINELVECINKTDARFIIVTNEIGLGLVPISRIGRLYRDVMGKANQRLAQEAEEVYLMVAGLPVQIKPSQHP